MTYRERPAVIPGAVVWEQHSNGPGEVLPDGCMDLLWMDGTIMVAGPDTKTFPVHGDGSGTAGIRFRPGLLPAVLGVPASRLRDQRVPLTDLITPGHVDRLRLRIDRSESPARGLEAYAAEVLAARPPDARTKIVMTVAAMVAAGHQVARISRRTGLGERQLHRLGLQYFGYGPTTLRRILRLQYAFRLARSTVPAADIAAAAGYSDQAHLVRDCRALTGRSFGDRVVGAEAEYDARP